MKSGKYIYKKLKDFLEKEKKLTRAGILLIYFQKMPQLLEVTI